jgi:hypothetical protein
MHKRTFNKTIESTFYTKESLEELPYECLIKHFSKALLEMIFVKEMEKSVQI